ncbi:MAG: pyridoxal phosphate-dependent class II aminotransferase [Veillonella sp.]|uniref:pyridoxal phosphate-dependent aminotransferase n=1 Tax=Veillonella sp. TaxID=1926307 RepID=UPI0025F168A4|nr:threonine-phosphate decarboxylase [Veillonella sp.]MBS4912763.1 pyridoxal phosphate-dependent class II aminotransferase [Veillonella sp.]
MSGNQHGGNIYEFSAAHQVDEKHVLDFSANINPLGMSPLGRRALERSWEQCIHYPDIHNKGLLTALSTHLSLPAENILVGNGAAELLYGLMASLVNSTVYVPAPGFSEYEKGARAFNKNVVSYRKQIDSTGRSMDASMERAATFAERIIDASTGSVVDGSLLIMGNPNNPDGSLIDPDELDGIISKWKSYNSFVLVDESFIEFTDESHSARPLLKKYDNLLILHSLTKFYAVPGLRLGALLGAPALLEQVKQVLPAWSVNRAAQIYGEAALADKEYIEASKVFIQKEKQRFSNALMELPFLQVVQPTVNFILVRWLPESPDLQALTAFLNRRYIMIRNCEAYEGLGTGWFRIAVKREEENDMLLTQVKEFADEHNLFSSTWSD